MTKNINRPAAQSDGAPMLASREMAALYVKQGSYERGIEMYKRLLEQAPESAALKDQLEDAETLASLLTVRDETQVYDRGFREGYSAARTQVDSSSSGEKIARLNAWLERIQAKQ